MSGVHSVTLCSLAQEFARRLAAHYDPALFQVTLFGFRVWGDTDKELAFDFFVAL